MARIVYCAIKNYAGALFSVDDEEGTEGIRNKACELLGIEPDITRIHASSSNRIAPEHQPLHFGIAIAETNGIDGYYELDYYWSRQLIMYGPSFGSLRNAKVVVVGAGAIGNEVTKNLAMSGIGSLVIVDPDTIENSNLSRTCMFRPTDIGKKKAEALAEHIRELGAHTDVKAYPCMVQAPGFDRAELLDADVLIGTVDSFSARFDIFALGRQYDLPVFDGGARTSRFDSEDGWQVCIQAMLNRESGCMACGMREETVRRLVSEYHGVSCTNPAEPSDINMHAVAGAHLACEVVFFLSSHGEVLDGIEFIEPMYKRYNVVQRGRSPDCVVCGTIRPYERIRDNSLLTDTKGFVTLSKTSGASLIRKEDKHYIVKHENGGI